MAMAFLDVHCVPSACLPLLRLYQNLTGAELFVYTLNEVLFNESKSKLLVYNKKDADPYF